MKNLGYIGIVILSFIITGCSDNIQDFASSAEKPTRVRGNSSDDERPPFAGALDTVVTTEADNKIGRGTNKKGQSIDIRGTMGHRNLDPVYVDLSIAQENKGKSSRVSSGKADSNKIYIRRNSNKNKNAKADGDASKVHQLEVKEEGKIVAAKPAITSDIIPVTSNQQEANVLFFVNSRLAHVDANVHKENCWSDFNQSAKDYGFLSYLNSLDWRVSMSFFSDENPELYLLTKRNQGMFSENPVEPTPVLSKDMYDLELSEEVVSDSVTPFAKRWSEINRQDDHLPELVSPRPDHEDVLGALSNLLIDNPVLSEGRSSKLNVVVVDNGQFPFYKEEEWRKFYSLHPHVKLLLLSSRRSNISNLLHVIQNRQYIEWLPLCSYQDVSVQLGKYLSY